MYATDSYLLLLQCCIPIVFFLFFSLPFFPFLLSFFFFLSFPHGHVLLEIDKVMAWIYACFYLNSLLCNDLEIVLVPTDEFGKSQYCLTSVKSLFYITL